MLAVAAIAGIVLMPRDPDPPSPSALPSPALPVAQPVSVAPTPVVVTPEASSSVATTGATDLAVAARAREPETRPESAARPRAATATGSSGALVGALTVQSVPQGASVFINNEYAGRTPLTVRTLPAGSRAVRVSLDGYGTWSRGVRVVANQSTSIRAQLTPDRTSN